MSYPVIVTLPNDLRQPLIQVASAMGQSPEEWIVAMLRQQLTQPDARLRRHFGAVNLGRPTGADNARIDADLAASYGDPHKEPG
jgi:hypothetical protein